MFFIFACQEPEDDAVITEPEVAITDNSRIKVLNQSVKLELDNKFTSKAKLPSIQTQEVKVPNFKCSESISKPFTGNKKIENRKTICLNAETSFSGTLEMKGGTFVIRGNAVITAVNGSKGKIVVLESGSLTMRNFNLNNNIDFVNYGGTIDLQALTISGSFENHSKATVQSVTVNGGGEFENTGEMLVSNNFTINKKAKNEGTLEVKGNLIINGGGELENACKLLVEGNLQNNKTLKNKGYVEVGGTLTLNGGARVEFDSETYLVTKNLSLNGTLKGSTKAYARIDISNSSVLNWGSVIQGKLDVNDSNGFEVNNSRMDKSVTIDKAVEIKATPCNPGSEVPLVNPEYTLVANIEVPTIAGSVLSATDVFYKNGLAFISYHLNGADFAGAIDVLNLSSINVPTFDMNFSDSKREFNAVAYNGSTLYLAGQRNTDESKYKNNDTRGAILYAVGLNSRNQLLPLKDWKEIPMPSFSGNSIDILSDSELLFASGATGGGFFKINLRKGEISNSQKVDFAKYVTSNDEVSVMLSGGPGDAQLFIQKDGSTRKIALGKSAFPVDGKNAVALDGETAYVALGKNGLVVVDTDTGKIAANYKSDKPGNTNGVAVDKDFVYLANGESGVLLLRKKNLEFYGQYEYAGSANSVEVIEKVILIANGTGGIKLLVRKS